MNRARTLFATLLCAAALDAHACGGRLHIEVPDSGVYTLDYAHIVAVQPQFTDCASADLVLTNRDQEVPIRVLDDGSGRFGAGARIEWLGRALHGPQSWFDQYSSVNVYQLAAAPGAHARVHEPAVAGSSKPAALRRTLHLEQENLMLRVSDREMKPGDEPDVWQWAKLTPIDPQPFAVTFDAADLDARAAAPVALTLVFRGVSNVNAAKDKPKAIDHVVALTLNGKPLPQLSWDGRDEWRKTLELPRDALKDRGNRLEIRVAKRDLPGDATGFIVDVVMFNWLEAAYPIRGDLTADAAGFTAAGDGVAAVRAGAAAELFGSDGSWQALAGGRANVEHGVEYFAATPAGKRAPALRAVAAQDLRADSAGYDYLIVAHPRLLEAIQPLAQYHRAHGMRVDVVDVEDVYDTFNGGIVHPRAIRDLVAWGAQHWARKPRYLLLVGDASFDIHHDQRTNGISAQQLAIRTQLDSGELLLPNGRLNYMGTTRYSHWSEQLPNRNLIPTFQFPTAEGQSATDNDFVAIKPGDFHPQLAVGRLPVVEPAEVAAIVDKTIAYLTKPTPGEWQRDVTFVSTSEVASFKGTSDQIAGDLERRGFAVNSVYSDFGEKDNSHYQNTRELLKRDLDAGNLIVHFLGHGGQFIWRVGPIGDLFTLEDVSALTNAGRYPMVLAMTCFSAPFDHPTEDSIGERFLRERDKGAVAVFAASWSNWPNPENSRALIEALLKPGATIGDAILGVKQHTQDRTLVEMYNLLGDPALVLAQPREHLQFARGSDRWNSQMLVRIPAPDFGGVVDVDWLDAAGKVLASRRYQARDRQFTLPLVDGAATVSVYARDTRDGFAAFGAASVLPPAPPPPVPSAGILASAAAATPAKPAAPRRPRKVDPRDDISHLDFDAP